MIILTSNIVKEVTLMLLVSENLYEYQLRLLYPFRTIILIPLYNCGCEMYRVINRFYTSLIWFSSNPKHKSLTGYGYIIDVGISTIHQEIDNFPNVTPSLCS